MIAVRKKIVSKELIIPELEEFIGKNVVIYINEESDNGSKEAFFDCINNIEIDELVIENSREISVI
ncbi:MAG: hypothetical protein KGZ71_07990 [Desulfobulbaceae bacterium]|nr:hypothetical protein [Candidatus Kapabacteria bacterium]MBS4000405.1 hypothetical protein [Desulfobulbaceae bacterium]